MFSGLHVTFGFFFPPFGENGLEEVAFCGCFAGVKLKHIYT